MPSPKTLCQHLERLYVCNLRQYFIKKNDDHDTGKRSDMFSLTDKIIFCYAAKITNLMAAKTDIVS
jgi:hypothetical protein